jgi:hypothetical protein
MIWVSPMLSFRGNDILGRIITVTSIVMLTMWNRVAGIIALIVVIAIMQNRSEMEGFTLPNTVSSPIIGTTSSSSDTWNTPDEFKQKFCTKVVLDGMDSLVYALKPNSKLVAYDSSGKMTDVGESHKRIDWPSVLSCGDTKNPINGKDQSGGVVQLCNPTCNWKMANQTEGFTATIENSPILNAKNSIKDHVQKAKKMTESFFSR